MRYTRAWSGAAVGLVFAVLPCAVAGPAESGAVLGRLFTAPGERAVIDKARTSSSTSEIPAVTAVDPVTAAPVAGASLRVDGVVRRGRGRDDLWLNGAHTRAAGGVAAGNRVPVSVPGGGRTVWLKPGQVFDAAAGVVRESYQDGRADR